MGMAWHRDHSPFIEGEETEETEGWGWEKKGVRGSSFLQDSLRLPVPSPSSFYEPPRHAAVLPSFQASDPHGPGLILAV